MPIGLIGSLAICTIFYLLVAAGVLARWRLARLLSDSDLSAPQSRLRSRLVAGFGGYLVDKTRIFVIGRQAIAQLELMIEDAETAQAAREAIDALRLAGNAPGRSPAGQAR